MTVLSEVYLGPVRVLQCDERDGGYPPEIVAKMKAAGYRVVNLGKAGKAKEFEGQMRLDE